MATILYLHSLDSKPDKMKIAHLEKLGHKVIAPAIDYRESKHEAASVNHRLLTSLGMVVEGNDVEAVIGNGWGADVASWLGWNYGIPAISFFPDMDFILPPVPVGWVNRNYPHTALGVYRPSVVLAAHHIEKVEDFTNESRLRIGGGTMLRSSSDAEKIPYDEWRIVIDGALERMLASKGDEWVG
jgi:predicted esterase YcpF (UPF0227 family)